MSATIAKRFFEEITADIQHRRLLLPTLPEVALKVREVADDPNSSVSDLTKVIATDVALAARIIQVANSPLMRASKAIESLDAAVSRLGTKLVRDMAVSMAMEQMFQATSDVTDRKLRELWEHSVQVASISYALAARYTRLRPDQAMLAGLVHDIGALPIISRAEDVPELMENERIFERIVQTLTPIIGKMILEAWHFPPELVAVAVEHRKVERNSPQVDYVDVVIVASLQSYLGTDHPLAKVDWSTVPALAKLGLAGEVNVVEMEATAEQAREVRSLLVA